MQVQMVSAQPADIGIIPEHSVSMLDDESWEPPREIGALSRAFINEIKPDLLSLLEDIREALRAFHDTTRPYSLPTRSYDIFLLHSIDRELWAMQDWMRIDLEAFPRPPFSRPEFIAIVNALRITIRDTMGIINNRINFVESMMR